MWMFWTLFLIAAIGVLMPGRLPAGQSKYVFWVVGVVFASIIGFRHEVGGDWLNYIPHFLDASGMDLAQASTMGDPGHYVLNMLVARLGGDIYAVNLIYAALLMLGTVVFCRRQANPWLALLAAVPYMLIVVGMGYTRQSVALGFALLGLVALGEQRIRRFVLLIAVGALFHKSAVLLLPIAALAASRNRFLTWSIVLVSTVLLYYLLLVDSTEALWTNYVEAQMESQGSLIRVFMNVLPAVLLLVYRDRIVPDEQDRKLWLWIAWFSLACIPLVFLASTAVDRVALYLIPIQLFVFSRLPRLARTTQTRTSIVLGIVAYYAAVQYVWLNYATHAQYWIPYQFMPVS